MSGKKLLGKPRQYSSLLSKASTYACKIQNWKFGSVLATAYPVDSRKAYCKVCKSAIIDIFFGFNCCKKDQNNTDNLSEWTSSGAVKTLRRQESIIPFNRGGSSRRAAGLQPSLKNLKQKIPPNGQTHLKFGYSYENFTTQSFSVLPTPFLLNVS